MVTPTFLLKIVTLPYTLAKTVIQYYTTGTIYSRTNAEFTNSLWKNIHLASLYHLSGNLQKQDVVLVLHHPLQEFFDTYRNNPMAIGLKNFGKKLDDHAYWLVQNEVEGPEKEDVLIYAHGGGYLLNMFETQMVAFLALYHALPEERRNRTSILFLDYSTTANNFTYPTQLREAIYSYNGLVEQGYKNIHLIGDSAGVHLICSIARYIAYPEEAKEQFKHFPKFDFSFHGELVQPKSLILMSPWVQPTTAPNLPPVLGANPYGDLGATDTSMGDYYVGDNDRKLIDKWITFNSLSYDEHWAQVEAIDKGNTLVIYGEREILREGIEKFYDNINKKGNIIKHMEKGGIHASLVYVEALNYMGKAGARKALDGDFDGRYNINLIVDFLERF
ncbi:Arylacetamide deacetylase [Suhomyces tanzawaensis NRRL Y-17324]|uniref:Arylacetamide deacetylase n=1 Tax=Suhomyces tanzawaensis NRRL Y-17324 TaxID=984487 RepID=A0A1E4SJS7_9ASCO|nr:Arylacetamide deacetylase [Suhomyces tanzawaensis NRRL Y-17324]ODV79687.1 Arylacetamide deacetylase [Suhomyces tanzawaensis NRRL Y-17324]